MVHRVVCGDGVGGGGRRPASLVARLPGAGLALLVAGGVLYTAGAVVFLFDSRVRFAHFVWHLFVLGGSACHFFAVLQYAQ